MMLGTEILYTLFILATAIERLVEVRLSNKNAAAAFEQGGVEFGKGHYPFMVVLHTGFLLACVGEVWILERTFEPIWGSLFLLLAILCQALRWWCISTLGERWNTRVILVPGGFRVAAGPYRYFRHPNYMVVALEGLALPLIHSAWLSAITFTLLNMALMWVRISCEERALQEFLTTEQLQTTSDS
jgi:methyltransferase